MYERLTTPICEVKYANLSADNPNVYQGDANWRAIIVLDPGKVDHKQFLAKIKELAEKGRNEIIDEKKNSPKQHYPYRQKEDGTYEIELRKKVYRKDKTTGQPSRQQPPTVVDMGNAKISGEVVDTIGNGSKMRFQLGIKDMFFAADNIAGITIYLNKAQLVDLVEAGEKFDDIEYEGGYYVSSTANTDEIPF